MVQNRVPPSKPENSNKDIKLPPKPESREVAPKPEVPLPRPEIKETVPKTQEIIE